MLPLTGRAELKRKGHEKRKENEKRGGHETERIIGVCLFVSTRQLDGCSEMFQTHSESFYVRANSSKLTSVRVICRQAVQKFL